MWDIETFSSYLQESFNRDIWKELQEKIKKLVILSLSACAINMVNRKNSHELLGYDIMVDELFNVWLIEVNSSPAMDYSTVRIILTNSMLLKS
jgi:tubulin monoglycylase TTLL3/8